MTDSSQTSAAFNPSPSVNSLIKRNSGINQIVFTDMKELYGKMHLASNFFTQERESDNPYCLRNGEKGKRAKLTKVAANHRLMIA